MNKGTDFNWLKRQCKDKKSRQWISQIQKWYRLTYEKGEFITDKKLFPVNLGKYKIWFRKNSAYSSVDIYNEIFRENHHLDLPEFSGNKAKWIIDLGANEGYYTLKIKQNNPKCRVIAVEPNPFAFELIKKNIESNQLRGVALENKSICPSSRKMELAIVEQITPISGKGLDFMKRPWLKKRMIKKIKVDCMNLEELFKKYSIPKVDILKIDIEGMEFEILKNSRKLLPKVNKVVVEWHSEELKKQLKVFMKKNSFELLFEKEDVCDDLYFINKKLSAD